MTRVGVYLGSTSDPTENIERVLAAWGEWMEDTELDAFGSATLPESVREYYVKIDTDNEEWPTPLGKIGTSYRDAIEYVQKRDPDVLIQLWKYHTHAPGVALAGRRTNTPTVTRINGDVYNEYAKYSGFQRAGTYFLDNVIGVVPPRLSDKMVAFGPFGEQEVVNRGMSPEDVVLLPPPKPVGDRFSPTENDSKWKRKLSIPPDRPAITTVGRLTESKGIPFLIKVMRKVLSERDVTFVVIGDGPFREKLRREFAEHVVAPGYVSHENIDQYYKASDMYVHTSPYEGIPLVILEALSCGLPVAARPAGDIPFFLDSDDLCTTPDEMVNWILEEPEKYTWENFEYFATSYQKQTLQELFSRS